MEKENENCRCQNNKWVKESFKTMVEIERLKALITELADALELPFEEWTDQSDLIHRAREATR